MQKAQLSKILIMCWFLGYSSHAAGQLFSLRGGYSQLIIPRYRLQPLNQKEEIPIPGYHFGFVYEKLVRPNRSIRLGAVLESSGSHQTSFDRGRKYSAQETKLRINRLRVPLHIQKWIYTNEQTHVYFHGGLQLGVFLGGRQVQRKIVQGQVVEQNDKLLLGSGSGANMGYIDYGIGFGGGLAVGDAQVGLVYYSTIPIYLARDSHYRRSSFQITTGYLLGSRKAAIQKNLDKW